MTISILSIVTIDSLIFERNQKKIVIQTKNTKMKKLINFVDMKKSFSNVVVIQIEQKSRKCFFFSSVFFRFWLI